jgi:hypothetical protein
MKPLHLAWVAACLVAMTSPTAMAQGGPSASTAGSGGASPGSGTIGTGGSGAAGGTSATTLGLGGTSTGAAGTSSSIGGGASAATVDGKASTTTKVQENPNKLQEQSKAKAQDGGTWSKSRTDTRIKQDELTSRTKSMSHVPGGPPAKSTTREEVPVSR